MRYGPMPPGAGAPMRARRDCGGLIADPFFTNDRADPWSIVARERWHARMIAPGRALGQHWEDHGRADAAVVCYENGPAIDSPVEHFYQRLISLHAGRGHRAEALRTYERCHTTR